MLLKIIKFSTDLLSSMPVDTRIEYLCERLESQAKSLKPSTIKKNHAVIAVEGVEDPLFFGLFSVLVSELKVATSCTAQLIQIRSSINSVIGCGRFAWVFRSWLVCSLVNRQWSNASKYLVGNVAYRSHSISNPLCDLVDWVRAYKLWKSLREQHDISSLVIDGVLVGDLVIDSYLRFRPSPVFDVTDRFVIRVLWQCIRDLRLAIRWFSRVRPPLYLSSYSTYVDHGVAVRVALSLGSSVYVYGNPSSFGMKLSNKHPYHTPVTSAYKSDFEDLLDQDACLKLASQQMNLRLSGGIDMATAYMRFSAYTFSNESIPNVFGAVIVFMHDFYDSPHIYPDLIFPDFWTWINFTIITLREAGIPFYIKPHPNQIALSDMAFNQLIAIHKDVQILSSQITNKQLVQAGMLCGVTVHGTVAHELAFFGIPTICCAKHPHHTFDFCRTASTVGEYANMLRTPEKSRISIEEMKRQSLSFYYMHNLNESQDVLEFRRQYIELWKISHSQKDSAENFLSQLNKLQSLPGWKLHIKNLIEEITNHVL